MINDHKTTDNKSDNTLHTITMEFPKHKHNITRLFYESSIFLELCEDYVCCLDTIKKMESMNDPKEEKEINDLKYAMTELREELLSKI